MKNRNVRTSIFSFFSGSGLLDLGFENAGYKVVFVNELSKSFLNAYQYSREKLGHEQPLFGYHNNDINEFLNGNKDVILRAIKSSRDEHNLVGFIGGPPCPDFSIAGKNKGSEGENGKLSKAYIDLIIATQPDYFLFENVKGLWSTARHRAYYESLKTDLQKAGYVITDRLCNALEFGVPQDRNRIFMIGIKPELLASGSYVDGTILNFPWERYIRYNKNYVKSLPWQTTTNFGETSELEKELIPELTVQYWFDRNDVKHHPNALKYFRPRSGIIKMRSVPEGDVSRKSYKRLHRFRYSPTAAYGNNEVHLHPFEERRISAAEAMALQSMPKEFALPPEMTLSNMFKTIGNGVPYLMANGIAKTLFEYLEDNICKK